MTDTHGNSLGTELSLDILTFDSHHMQKTPLKVFDEGFSRFSVKFGIL